MDAGRSILKLLEPRLRDGVLLTVFYILFNGPPELVKLLRGKQLIRLGERYAADTISRFAILYPE